MTFLELIIVIVTSLLLQKKLKSPLIYSITGSLGVIFALYIMLIILYTISFKALVILLLIIANLTVYIYRKYVSNWKQITPAIDDVIEFSNQVKNQAVNGEIVGSDIPVNRSEHFNMGTQNNIS